MSNCLGKVAEQAACKYLEHQGLYLVQRNYRCKQGEIDLIMCNTQERYIFIEVRSRARGYFGRSIETVSLGKQQRIIKTAQYFLHTKRLTDKVNCRFDVVCYDGRQVQWVPNAFWLRQ